MTEDEIKEFEAWRRDEGSMVSGLTPVPNCTEDNYKIIYWETEHRFTEYRKKIIWIKSYEEAKEAQIAPSKSPRVLERAKLKRYEEALKLIAYPSDEMLAEMEEIREQGGAPAVCELLAQKALEQ